MENKIESKQRMMKSNCTSRIACDIAFAAKCGKQAKKYTKAQEYEPSSLSESVVTVRLEQFAEERINPVHRMRK